MSEPALAVEVSVPATSANLGPGYDALGLALDLRDTVVVEALPVGHEDVVSVEGEGAEGPGAVPRDGTHLVLRSLRAALEELGRPTPPVRLACRNRVPHGRGLGSSSAAIVAGVAAARMLAGVGPDAGSRAPVDGPGAGFDLVARLEGHPDNVAPAWFGGLTVAWQEGAGRFAATRLPVHPDLRAVALVPPTGVATTLARGMLPPRVPHADAAFNAGRSALLVTALRDDPTLLLAATEDRLHQPYRASAMPESHRLVGLLRSRGLAAVVSGAGPSVLVLLFAGQQGEVAGSAPPGWQALDLTPEPAGVRVVRAG